MDEELEHIYARHRLADSTADDFLEAALPKKAVSRDRLFLLTLPHIIVGAINAYKLPVTKKTVDRAIDMLLDSATVEIRLFPNLHAAEAEADLVCYEMMSRLDPKPEIDGQEISNLAKSKLFAQIEASWAKQDLVRPALAKSIRIDLGLPADMDDHDVINHAIDRLANACKEIIVDNVPEAESEDHPIWKTEVLDSVVRKMREEVLSGCAELIKNYGLHLKPDSGEAPNGGMAPA